MGMHTCARANVIILYNNVLPVTEESAFSRIIPIEINKTENIFVLLTIDVFTTSAGNTSETNEFT